MILWSHSGDDKTRLPSLGKLCFQIWKPKLMINNSSFYNMSRWTLNLSWFVCWWRLIEITSLRCVIGDHFTCWTFMQNTLKFVKSLVKVFHESMLASKRMNLTNTQITFTWKPDSAMIKKKKKKIIATFYLTIQFNSKLFWNSAKNISCNYFFLRTVRYKLAVLRKKAELRDINSEFRFFSSQFQVYASQLFFFLPQNKKN